jgi:hypothetical protein
VNGQPNDAANSRPAFSVQSAHEDSNVGLAADGRCRAAVACLGVGHYEESGEIAPFRFGVASPLRPEQWTSDSVVLLTLDACGYRGVLAADLPCDPYRRLESSTSVLGALDEASAVKRLSVYARMMSTLSNRVAGGIAPSAPAPPVMRVRVCGPPPGPQT